MKRPAPSLVFLVFLAFFSLSSSPAVAASRPVEVSAVASYPELRVHGRPFFVHSAAFFYDRIPRAMWPDALERHRELGINTIDLYIPWNWHEPARGQFDFDGHTNPQRDLRHLLRLLRVKGFALIARPGPVILNEWRNGGYPAWLLERPEYEMPLGDVLEGRYPPLSELGARQAEEAARRWLANPTHLKFTRRWFHAVAAELSRFRQAGGILIAMQLDDDQAIGRANFVGADFWRYMEKLHVFLVEGFRGAGGRLDVPVFINPYDPRLTDAGFDPALPHPIAVMGQWYQVRPTTPTPGAAAPARLEAEDRNLIPFFGETLAMQPAFPAMIIEFQAGWYAPADDAGPFATDPRTTLVASRWLFAHGLHGLNYFPVQDTLTPAGYEVPWANRSYLWDAALAFDGRAQERAASVRRNGDLIRAVGPWLASSHKHADIGLVYPLGSFAQATLTRQDILEVSGAAMRLAAMAAQAGLSVSYSEPQQQPDEALARYRQLLLPLFAGERFAISERAASHLEKYVAAGGRLVIFPEIPTGPVLAQMFARAGISAGESGLITRGRYGLGEIVLVRAEISPESTNLKSAKPPATSREALSAELLAKVCEEPGRQPALRVETAGAPRALVDVTLLRSDAGSGESGAAQKKTQGWGFLAITNTDYENSALIHANVLDLRGEGTIPLDEILVPPADSLFLPLRLPLCAWGETCEEEIFSATAELAGLYAHEGELVTTWYAPGPATVVLRLPERPEQVTLDGKKVSIDYDLASKRLRITLSAGRAPQFRRELRIATGYEMDLPAPPALPAEPPVVEFTNALSFPVREGVELASNPPLVPLDSEHGSLDVHIRNHSGRTYRMAVRAMAQILEPGDGIQLEARPFSSAEARVPLRLKPGVKPGLYRARLTFGSRALLDRTVWLAVRPPDQAIAYRYDLDRDGLPDWVLENDELRVVVSPAAGARSFVLRDKQTGGNWFSNVGGFRDHFAYYEQAHRGNSQRQRGWDGLHNRPYDCQALPQGERGSVALRCTYDAPDVLPAGAQISKTIRLDGRSVTLDYEIQLRPAPGSSMKEEQAFIAVASIPADSNTSWREGQPGKAAGEPAPSARVPQAGEIWAVGGNAVRLERANGALEVRFEGAKGTIERKMYSIWLKMRYLPLQNRHGRYRLVYDVSAAK